MEDCLRQYTDDYWLFTGDDVKNWMIAAFAADFDTTSSGCDTLKNEVMAAYNGLRIAFVKNWRLTPTPTIPT